MYFADMATECQVDSGPGVRAVGWLDARHPFPTGPVSPVFVAALRRHLQHPWQPVATAGWHDCELCESKPVTGCANVWIPDKSAVYVAPELILHYIEDHHYRPPIAFIAAVMFCPEQGTPEYLRLIEPHTSHETA